MRATCRTLGAVVVAALSAVSACADGGGPAAGPALPPAYRHHASATYADDAHWLCRPGKADDACHVDLDATAVAADGTTEVLHHEPAAHPPVDCFYVYPTTSRDPGPNSDLVPAVSQEVVTVWNQVARLTSSCRVYAPVYRQVTLSALGRPPAQRGRDPRDVAYADVLDAFRHYVAHDSAGRGFVLVGHSQGGNLVARLVAEEIDDEPLLRDRLVAAYVLGASVQVPEGRVVGGSFSHVPLCRATDQTGCVVTYSSYRASRPPRDGALFGRSAGTTRAACVNPAAPQGGPAELHPYLPVEQPRGALLGGPSGARPFAGRTGTAEVATPWVTYPGLVTGECMSDGDFTYLALTVAGDPRDPRTDDIGGDLSDAWGMHLVDANVAMGDIEAMVARQAGAYAD